MASNPPGLVWLRESSFRFYTGSKADDYALELAADLNGSTELGPPVANSTLPQEKLPFVLRTNAPSFMEYIQAFYISVAYNADQKAKTKLEEIKQVNAQLKKLNEIIGLITEIDARSPDDSGSPKVKEAVVITVRNRWPDQTTLYPPPSTTPYPVGSVTSNADFYGSTLEGKKFASEYRSGLTDIGLDPQQDEYKIIETTDGAGIARIVRNLQAEATARGNSLQNLMAQTSSTINYQSAVQEGYKSYGERWFQMLSQASTTS